MSTTMVSVSVGIDEASIVSALQDLGEKLDAADGEVILDFSLLRRIDPSALLALEEFADVADGKAAKVVLRSVNVEIYRVLKLVRLAKRFSYVA